MGKYPGDGIRDRITIINLVASANFNEDRGLVLVPRFDNTKNPSPNQTENPLLRSEIVLAGGNKRQSGDEDGVLTAISYI